MFYIRTCLFLYFFILSQTIICSESVAFCFASPSRECEVPVEISSITCVGELGPHEIVERGCPLNVFFKKYVLPEQDDKMCSAWLRNLFCEASPELITKNELDYMLMHLVERGSIESIRLVLDRGADPCAEPARGDVAPLMLVFEQLYDSGSDPGTVFNKLHTMLVFVKHDNRIWQRPNQDYFAATQEYMAIKAHQMDCLLSLRRKFIELGKIHSPRRYKKYKALLAQIYDLLPLAVESSSEDEY